MIPNMYKIAGELTPLRHARHRAHPRHPRAVHLRRPLRRHGLPLRPAGPCWPPIPCRKAHDFALIAQAATLESRVPFLHFFDGFRTSHEVNKSPAPTTTMRAMLDDKFVIATASARSRPTAPSCAAPRRTPTSSSRRASLQPLLPRRPRHRAGRDGSLRRSPAASYSSSTTSARPTPSASSSSWAPAARRRGDRRRLNRPGRKGRPAQGPPLPPFPSSASSPALPPPSVHRRARPHQGAGRVGEPLYQDVVTAIWPRPCRRNARPSPPCPRGHRRPLRPLLQGIHPAMVKGVFDELAKPARRTTSPSASTTT
jgi:pyruvate-ferredoxin/flavodoxin oxidoreductase